MARLHIWEFTSANPDGLPRLPVVASQSIVIGPVSSVSLPFNAGTRAIRVFADAACAVVVGNGELDALESDMPIAAGQAEFFAVSSGDRIAAISRVVENNMSDPFAIFSVIADPEACNKRMQELKAAAGELSKLQTETAVSQAKLAEERMVTEKEFAEAKAKADAELVARRQEFENERLRKENELAARAARLSEMETRAQADADDAAKLKADLRRRLDLLAQAGAA
jgi:hypothetical protein